MERVNQLQAYNKLWAALITSIISIIVTQFALDVPVEVQQGIVVVATAFFVWLVPNR